MDADPLFDDEYRLTSSSPAIDAGHNWRVPQDDFDLDHDDDLEELLPIDLADMPRFADVGDVPDTGCGSAVLVDMGACEAPGDAVAAMKLGDIDGNGSVGFTDLLTLLDEHGPCSPGCCSADLNLDGVVGFSDLLLLLDRWG